MPITDPQLTRLVSLPRYVRARSLAYAAFKVSRSRLAWYPGLPDAKRALTIKLNERSSKRAARLRPIAWVHPRSRIDDSIANRLPVPRFWGFGRQVCGQLRIVPASAQSFDQH